VFLSGLCDVAGLRSSASDQPVDAPDPLGCCVVPPVCTENLIGLHGMELPASTPCRSGPSDIPLAIRHLPGGSFASRFRSSVEEHQDTITVLWLATLFGTSSGVGHGLPGRTRRPSCRARRRGRDRARGRSAPPLRAGGCLTSEVRSLHSWPAICGPRLRRAQVLPLKLFRLVSQPPVRRQWRYNIEFGAVVMQRSRNPMTGRGSRWSFRDGQEQSP
jgi:hypothetical protein